MSSAKDIDVARARARLGLSTAPDRVIRAIVRAQQRRRAQALRDQVQRDMRLTIEAHRRELNGQCPRCGDQQPANGTLRCVDRACPGWTS